MTTSIVVGFVLLRVIDGTNIAEGDTGRSIGPGIDIVVGLASLALAYAVATGRDLPFAARRAARKERRAAEKEGEEQRIRGPRGPRP